MKSAKADSISQSKRFSGTSADTGDLAATIEVAPQVQTSPVPAPVDPSVREGSAQVSEAHPTDSESLGEITADSIVPTNAFNGHAAGPPPQAWLSGSRTLEQVDATRQKSGQQPIPQQPTALEGEGGSRAERAEMPPQASVDKNGSIVSIAAPDHSQLLAHTAQLEPAKGSTRHTETDRAQEPEVKRSAPELKQPKQTECIDIGLPLRTLRAEVHESATGYASAPVMKPLREVQPIRPRSEGHGSGVAHASGVGATQLPVPIAFDLRPSSAKEPALPVQSSSAPPKSVFGALDSETRPSAPIWTHTEKNLAEAGFQDGTAGWVRVRAQLDATGIHAAVVPASTDAREVLSSHLSGLGTFLSEHQVPVDTWTLAPPDGPAQHQSAVATGDNGTAPDNNQRNESEQHGQTARSAADPGVRASSHTRAMTRPIDASPATGIEKGSHVSVIA